MLTSVMTVFYHLVSNLNSMAQHYYCGATEFKKPCVDCTGHGKSWTHFVNVSMHYAHTVYTDRFNGYFLVNLG